MCFLLWVRVCELYLVAHANVLEIDFDVAFHSLVAELRAACPTVVEIALRSTATVLLCRLWLAIASVVPLIDPGYM